MISRRTVLGGLASAALCSKAASATPPEAWASKLISAATTQIGKTVLYDPAYTKIAYPGGDVEIEKGVCTDVIIRAYRDGLRVDLQKRVHDDMAQNFSAYPALWGLAKPDTNIDHRRVPNLQTFFKRHGAERAISTRPQDYQPGDIITVNLPGNLAHIALVTDQLGGDGTTPLCIHNIGRGAQLEDVLFAFDLTGHYRFRA